MTDPIFDQESRKEEFIDLFDEFMNTYYIEDPENHKSSHLRSEIEARAISSAVVRAIEKGEDITNLVLEGLLPYSDKAGNRAKGLWTHVAPAINTDSNARKDEVAKIIHERYLANKY